MSTRRTEPVGHPRCRLIARPVYTDELSSAERFLRRRSAASEPGFIDHGRKPFTRRETERKQESTGRISSRPIDISSNVGTSNVTIFLSTANCSFFSSGESMISYLRRSEATREVMFLRQSSFFPDGLLKQLRTNFDEIVCRLGGGLDVAQKGSN